MCDKKAWTVQNQWFEASMYRAWKPSSKFDYEDVEVIYMMKVNVECKDSFSLEELEWVISRDSKAANTFKKKVDESSKNISLETLRDDLECLKSWLSTIKNDVFIEL